MPPRERLTATYAARPCDVRVSNLRFFVMSIMSKFYGNLKGPERKLELNQIEDIRKTRSPPTPIQSPNQTSSSATVAAINAVVMFAISSEGEV